MECKNCGKQNESDHTYCSECGQILKQICSNCQTQVIDAKFCPQCGQGLQLVKSEEMIEERPEPESSIQLEQEQGQEQTEAIEEAVEPDEAVPVESDEQLAEAAAEEPPEVTTTKKKWLIPTVAILLLLVGGTAAFALMGRSAPGEEATKIEKVTEEAVIVKAPLEFSVGEVSMANYPEVSITLQVDPADVEDLLSQKDHLIITEQERAQTLKNLTAEQDGTVRLVYDSTVFNEAINGEQRAIQLSFGDFKQSTNYQSLPQKPLLIDSFSCNTDAYPTVNCFFSIFDQNYNKLEHLVFGPSMIRLTEAGQPIEDVKIEKLDTSNVYTSTNIVMDLSTSMDAGDRIGRIKSVIQLFLDGVTIESKNLIGLLTFADREYITQYPFDSNKHNIANYVANMYTQGQCTALYEAINTAVFNTSYNEVNGSKYVIVFTDGEENCSDFVSVDTLIQNALQLGVTIYAVSEDNYSELAYIAESTNGSYTSIGNDYSLLQQFFKNIYDDKRSQYMLTYTSPMQKKQPRALDFVLSSHQYRTDSIYNEISPKLIDNFAVADVMQRYQIAWSIALSEQSDYPVLPYVTTHHAETNGDSVYNIMVDQIYGSLNKGGDRVGGTINVDSYAGEYLQYQTPDYELVDAEKVSNDHYKMRIVKRTIREAKTLVNRNELNKGFHAPLTTYRETAYTYNVVNQGGDWYVDTIEDIAVPVCYKDATYQTKYVRKDGKSSKSNGNCPGLSNSER